VTAVLASATLAGLCVALVSRPGPPRLDARSGGDAAVHPGSTGWIRRPTTPMALVVGAVAGGAGLPAVLLAVLGASAVLLTASAVLVAGGAAWLRSGARRRHRADLGRRRTVEACDALVAELRAGQPPGLALQRATEGHQGLRPAARAAVLGGDVPVALRQASTDPGCAGLATVAAAWQVAEGSGSGLAASLQQVSVGLRADDEVRVEVAASLAPARATARLLAVLPVFGLLLGAGLGGHPVSLLLSTPGGNGLLLAGVCLALAGTCWVERLADQVLA
jgi:tight adherence protein B